MLIDEEIMILHDKNGNPRNPTWLKNQNIQIKIGNLYFGKVAKNKSPNQELKAM